VRAATLHQQHGGNTLRQRDTRPFMGPPLVAPGATRSDGTVKLTCREYVDKTFNDPTFSPLASLISNVVLVAILVSTVSFVVGTEPALEGSPFLDQLEIVVVMIFSVEYVTRFLVTFESRYSFVLTPLNMIDLLAILPWYVEKVAGAGGGEVLRVLRVLRVVRIFRVFKVGDMRSKLEVFTLCMVNRSRRSSCSSSSLASPSSSSPPSCTTPSTA